MKIIDIETKTVNFKREKVFKIALGKGSDYASNVYVIVITDYSFVDSDKGVTGGFSADKDLITLSSGAGYGFDEYDF